MEIIELSASLFGEVVVAAVVNPQKDTGLFPMDDREAMMRESLAHLANVEVVMFTGLVVHLAQQQRADFVVKGLRSAADFEVEMQMAQMNHAVTGMHTLFIPSSPENGFLASKYIRDIARMGGDVAHLVPPPVARRLKELAS
jgi:pantetheine-phosphate adenylyltransferase